MHQGAESGLQASLMEGPRSAAWPVWVIAIIVTPIQFALQYDFFPLAHLTDGKRPLHIDSPFHQYETEVAREPCAEGRLTGYDPRFAGGELTGVGANASAKLEGLLSCAIGQSDAGPQIYEEVSFAAMVIAPALVVVTCGWLGLSTTMSALAGLHAQLCWWTGPLRWHHTALMCAALARGPARRPLAGMTIGAVVSMTWASFAAALPAAVALQPDRFSSLAWLMPAIPSTARRDADARRLRASPRPVVIAAGLLANAIRIAFFIRKEAREIFRTRVVRPLRRRPAAGQG